MLKAFETNMEKEEERSFAERHGPFIRLAEVLNGFYGLRFYMTVSASWVDEKKRVYWLYAGFGESESDVCIVNLREIATWGRPSCRKDMFVNVLDMCWYGNDVDEVVESAKDDLLSGIDVYGRSEKGVEGGIELLFFVPPAESASALKMKLALGGVEFRRRT